MEVYSQACHRHVIQQSGRVVTADVPTSLVAIPVKSRVDSGNVESNHLIQAKWETEHSILQRQVTAVTVKEAKKDSPPFPPEKIELYLRKYSKKVMTSTILSTRCGFNYIEESVTSSCLKGSLREIA